MIDVEQLMWDNGWRLFGKCRCGGRLQYKYRHDEKPKIEVRWYVKHHSFTIRDGNKTIVGYTPIGQLDAELKKL